MGNFILRKVKQNVKMTTAKSHSALISTEPSILTYDWLKLYA